MPNEDDFVLCRTFGHKWDVLGAKYMRSAVFKHQLQLRCTQCTMERFDALDALGEVVQRQYTRPKGYSYAKNETPSRAAFRRMVVGKYKRRGTQ